MRRRSDAGGGRARMSPKTLSSQTDWIKKQKRLRGLPESPPSVEKIGQQILDELLPRYAKKAHQ